MAVVYGESGYGDSTYGTTTTMTKSVQKTVTLEEKGKITIAVQNPGGSAITGVSVSISGTSSASAETDSSGQVVFDGVPIGDYTVTLTEPGYFEQTVSISQGEFA